MEMISELQLLRDQFMDCASAIDQLSKPILEKHGFTEEVQQKVLEGLVNEHMQNA
jgi:hypothetical protein